MYIKELHIKNFKCFNGDFYLQLNQGVNIVVGDNEAGKTYKKIKVTRLI